jgi:hypothetical protein
VTRFVVDCETLLGIAAGEIEVAAEHKLVAPTLVRSQALASLYEAARRGEISAAEGIERVTRINSLKVRFLGDKGRRVIAPAQCTATLWRHSGTLAQVSALGLPRNRPVDGAPMTSGRQWRLKQ